MVIPFSTFFLKEIKILSSCCYNKEDFREVMDLIGEGNLRCHKLVIDALLTLSGKFEGYEKMVTSRISLEDVVEKGFEELVNRKDHHIKILISPKK